MIAINDASLSVMLALLTSTQKWLSAAGRLLTDNILWIMLTKKKLLKITKLVCGWAILVSHGTGEKDMEKINLRDAD